MRVIFMGTAPFAEPTLRGLFDSPHDVVAVVTQPDRPRGRGRKASPPPVKTLAVDHGCRVLQPASLRRGAVDDELAALRPDAIVVAAYGNILPPSVLDIPAYGCINVHASLLPKYRGAAPVNWALMHGETVTGCTVIQMDEHVDTGAVWWRDACDDCGGRRRPEPGRPAGRPGRQGASPGPRRRRGRNPEGVSAARRGRHVRPQADKGAGARGLATVRRPRFTIASAPWCRGRASAPDWASWA